MILILSTIGILLYSIALIHKAKIKNYLKSPSPVVKAYRDALLKSNLNEWTENDLYITYPKNPRVKLGWCYGGVFVTEDMKRMLLPIEVEAIEYYLRDYYNRKRQEKRAEFGSVKEN